MIRDCPKLLGIKKKVHVTMLLLKSNYFSSKHIDYWLFICTFEISQISIKTVFIYSDLSEVFSHSEGNLSSSRIQKQVAYFFKRRNSHWEFCNNQIQFKALRWVYEFTTFFKITCSPPFVEYRNEVRFSKNPGRTKVSDSFMSYLKNLKLRTFIYGWPILWASAGYLIY